MNTEGTQSIERTLDVLEALSDARHGMGVTELANRVGLHKSTAHRIVCALAQRGYVTKRQDDGHYQIGIKLIELVSYYINSLELQTEARPFVAQISTELGLIGHLGVLEGDQVIYIERMDFLTGNKLYSQIGQRVHAYCSSLGKCLLCKFSKEQLAVTMKDCSFNRFTPATISSLDTLWEELLLVRERGWAMDNMEYSSNSRCIGAPVYDYRGEIIAALSASGSPTMLTLERIDEVAACVVAKAADLSRNLGYVP
ncbi:MAG: IclR family transcriptional regulator [Coriobacteriales bacterium]|jgi:DNA-binding IclR family transcriptional regulator|nr:IclR family transcriptional regulator [Coriobacteriales bacterium]